MKKLINIILLFFTLGCNKEADSQKTKELDILKAQSYEGYYLKSLQINEDNTYRISLFDNDLIVVIISVKPSDIEFRNNDTINAVYREIINGTYTGRYIIRLKSDFKITKYYI